jgi:hypothetical protein
MDGTSGGEQADPPLPSPDRPRLGRLLAWGTASVIIATVIVVLVPEVQSYEESRTQGSQRETAAQSILRNSNQSAQALWTNFQEFTPTTIDALARTQTSITYVRGTVAPLQGRNSVSVFIAGRDVIIMTALDGLRVCRGTAINESHRTLDNVPRGVSYFGKSVNDGGCKADTLRYLPPSTWQVQFPT